MKHSILACVLVGSFLASAAWAAEPTAAPAAAPVAAPSPVPKAVAGEDDLLQLNFPENMEVKLLVDYIARRLNLNIMYDQASLNKHVTVVAPAKVPTASLLSLLQSVLRTTGLALVDSDQPGWKKIVPVLNLVSVSGRIQQDPKTLEKTDSTLTVTQVFPLKFVTTAYVEQMIKPFLSTPGGSSFAVDDQRLVIVTDYADNLKRAAQLVEMLDKPGRQGTIRFVEVKNRDAADLAKQVTGYLQDKRRVGGGEKAGPLGLQITSEPRSNQLVVISTEGMEDEALKLIETLDVPTGAQTKTYRFQHIAPARIDKLARDSLGSEAGTAPYKATVDPEAGLLVVTASPAIHEKIAALGKELDVPVSSEQGHIRFYKLMNASAAEVLATIRALEGQEGGLATLMLEQPAGETIPQALQEKLSTGPNVPPSAPGQEAPPPPAYHPPASEKPKEAALPAAITPSTPTPPPPPYPTAVPAPSISTAPTTLQPLSTVPGGPGAPAVGASVGGPNGTSIMRTKNAVVAVDTNTNTLIVVAPPAIQQIYRQLILALDKRRPQVLIEVTMVTLDTSNDFSLGIELTQGRTNNEIKWLTFSSFGLSTIDPATAIPAIAATPGLNGVLLDPNAINVVVKALATNARAKVLSAPRVLVNDNATGTLSSVSESPFTSVNASNTVATTSFAGYASAGTTVALTPHISQDDYLRMAYSLTLSSFSGATGGSVPPPRQTNTVNSEVVIPDGYTIVVGGLKREDTSDTVSKVPLLGDIPGLGYLFSNLTKSKKESCLFVFIRPLILRDDQFKDLKYLSELDTAKAELPKGMPESEPMPMR